MQYLHLVSRASVQIATARDNSHKTIKFKKVIYSYPSITQSVIDSYFENMWEDNTGSNMGHHPTAEYGT